MRLDQMIERLRQKEALEAMTLEQIKEAYLNLLNLYFMLQNTIGLIARHEAFR